MLTASGSRDYLRSTHREESEHDEASDDGASDSSDESVSDDGPVDQAVTDGDGPRPEAGAFDLTRTTRPRPADTAMRIWSLSPSTAVS
jgi:hypothetical protein